MVAVTVKLYAPAVVGVPEMTPVVAFNVSPAGSAPAVTAYVGAGVPLPTRVVEAALPTVNAGIVPLIVVGATGVAATVPVKVRLVEPALLVAVTVKLYGPAVVGVPEMTPVVVFNVSPAGSEPPVTAYVGAGVPLPTKVVEAALPTVKVGIVPLIEVGAAIAGS